MDRLLTYNKVIISHRTSKRYMLSQCQQYIQANLNGNQKDIRKGILNQRMYICLFNYICIAMKRDILE